MKSTLLHIGLEKTGTTSIQFLLAENANRLRQAGVLVPISPHRGNNFHLAIAGYSNYRADGLTKSLKIFNQADLDKFRERTLLALKAELAQFSGEKVILSSEHFQSRLTTKADIQLVRRNLELAGLNNFKVVLYLRHPLKIALSHHGMAIKKGVYVSEDFYHPKHPRISQILRFKDTIEDWQSVFGEIDVRLYPEGKSPQTLLDDFFGAAGINREHVDFSLQEKRNVNLSADALLTLNLINRDSSSVRDLASSKWLFHELEKSYPGSGLSPTDEQVSLFDAHFREEFESIRAQWFPDRDKLFDPTWHSPMAVSNQDVLGISQGIHQLIRRARRRVILRKPLEKLFNVFG